MNTTSDARELAREVSERLLRDLRDDPEAFIRIALEASLSASQSGVDASGLAEAARGISSERDPLARAQGLSPEASTALPSPLHEELGRRLAILERSDISRIADLLSSYGVAVELSDLRLRAIFPDRVSIEWRVGWSDNRICAETVVESKTRSDLIVYGPTVDDRLIGSLLFEAIGFFHRVATQLRWHRARSS